MELGVGIDDIASIRPGRETASWQRHKRWLFDSRKGTKIIDWTGCAFLNVVAMLSQQQLENIYRCGYDRVASPSRQERTDRDSPVGQSQR